uniref:Small ribosomal subunit protein mS29 n=1 Tax=Serinus canaria TaxID=9135 RepID=A0A8C9NDT1_SERCA
MNSRNLFHGCAVAEAQPRPSNALHVQKVSQLVLFCHSCLYPSLGSGHFRELRAWILSLFLLLAQSFRQGQHRGQGLLSPAQQGGHRHKELLALLGEMPALPWQPWAPFLPYGERGTGKTLTLCHVVHYCSRQGWLVLHVPDAHLWVKNCKELFQSSYNKARLDQPLQASVWLKNFKTSNERFLEEIKTQKKYIWGRRESTEEGRPLREVVEQGLARARSASDAVAVLLRELKQQSQRGSFRLLVAVDGVNALWGRTTLSKEDKSPVSPEELTLVHSLRKMLTNDWTGGAIVTTLSQTGSLFKPSSAYTPQELLGKEGFDALDPFVPIPVPNYSPKEFESCYGYYLERRWLQHEKGQYSALCPHSRLWLPGQLFPSLPCRAPRSLMF